jgi:DNA modification methylase
VTGAAAGGAAPYYASPSGDVVLWQGDCEAVLPMLPAESVDAIVTDPPYGLGFMGKEWDSFSPGAVADRAARKARKDTPVPDGQAGPLNSSAYVEYDYSARGLVGFQRWCEVWAREALRVLKPGGYLVAFGSPRTYHRLACGLEDGGFAVKDSLMFLHGQGFPKSRNLGDGWGTALKPAYEPIALAQKPLDGTYAANVVAHGVGGLNIAACRIEGAKGDGVWGSRNATVNRERSFNASPTDAEYRSEQHPAGRWPANVLLDDEAAALLDARSGTLTSNSGAPFNRHSDKFRHAYGAFEGQPAERGYYGDTGGASRFFYTSKASRAERNAGLRGMAEERPDPSRHAGQVSMNDGEGNPYNRGVVPRANHHPTVKPLAVCAWLVRLVTPAGGVVLDPFMGSGSIGCAAVPLGYRYVGIEREAAYLEIAAARVRHWAGRGRQAGLDLGAAAGG